MNLPMQQVVGQRICFGKRSALMMMVIISMQSVGDACVCVQSIYRGL